MDISDIVISASPLELGTVVFLALSAVVAFFVALMTRKHYRQKNVYDQWMVALSQDYHKQNTKVILLIEKRGKCESIDVGMIKEINNNPEFKQAVNYVLDYWDVKGTSAKFKIIDRDLAIPIAYREIIYYFEGLHPWILYKRGYLFSIKGDSISNEEMLLKYLMDDLSIECAENAEVKSDDGKTIHISKDKLEIGSITIDEKNEKASLKISEVEKYDLTVEKKSGKLNIYRRIGEYCYRCTYNGFEWLYDYCIHDLEYEKIC